MNLQSAPFPWTLRTRRAGDRFRPRAGRTRKISDWLIDGAVPAESRDQLAVLEDAAGQIFFVEGLRPSDALCEGKELAHFTIRPEMKIVDEPLMTGRRGASASATMDPNPVRQLESEGAAIAPKEPR